jgi:hypothetical protein
MNLRCLRISVLLILAFSMPSYGQSLGDVARQIRAERQEQGSHPAVITNDDLESTEPAPDVSPYAFQNETKNESEESAPAANSAESTSKSAKGGKDSAKEREHEIQKRSDEINKVYLDRIAALRTQMNAARVELAKLQLAQVESTNDFHRTAGASPNIATYEDQQRQFNEQIEAQHNLIDSLKGQLEDAQEAARHAGVPHAYD